MEKLEKIHEGKTRAFLVCDKSFLEFDAPFVQWLLEEGFKIGWCKGHYSNCPWMYIDITRKLYAYGMPGIAIVPVIGEHAITLDEFKTIYAIYKKYEGKELFTFYKERFDCYE
jgi:hypothetical protein